MEDFKDISLCSEDVRAYGLNPQPQLNMPVLDLSVYEFYLGNPNQKCFYTLFTDRELTNVDSNYDVYRRFGFNVVKPDYSKRDFVLAMDTLIDDTEELVEYLTAYILCYIPKGFYPNRLYIRDAIYYSEDERMDDVSIVKDCMKQAFTKLDAIYYLISINDFPYSSDYDFDDILTSVKISSEVIESTCTFLVDNSSYYVTSYRDKIPAIENNIKYKTILDSERIKSIFTDIRFSYANKTLEGYSNCFQFNASGAGNSSKLSQSIASVLEIDVSTYIDELYDFAVRKSITSLDLFDNVSADENIYSNIIPVYKNICERLYKDIITKVNSSRNPNNVRVLLCSDKVLDSKLRSSFFAIVIGMKVVYDFDSIIPRDFVGLYNKYVNIFFISKFSMLLEDKLTYLYNIPPVMLNVTNKSLNIVYKESTKCELLTTIFDVDDLLTYRDTKLFPPTGDDVKITLDTLMEEFELVSTREEFNLTSSKLSELGEGHNKLKDLLLAARDGLIASTSGKDSDLFYSNPPTILNSILLRKEGKTYLAFCRKLDFKYIGVVHDTTKIYKSLDTFVSNLFNKKGINLNSTIDYTCSNLEETKHAFSYPDSFTLDDLYVCNLIDINVLYERRALASMCFMNGSIDAKLYSEEIMTYLRNIALGVKPYRSVAIDLDTIGIYMLSRLKTFKVSGSSNAKVSFENLSLVSSQNYLASALYSNIVHIYRDVIKPCYDRTFINLADFKYFDITNSPTYTIVGTDSDGLIRNCNQEVRKFSHQISIKDRIRCGKEGIPDTIMLDKES